MSNSQGFTKKLVIAVDDDSTILDLYQAALHDICDIRTFSDPQKALSCILECPPSVAILDRRFPEFPNLTGDGICRQLRENPKTQKLPIMVVSGMDEIENITRMMEQSKITTYFTKPIGDLERFRSQVNYYLEQDFIENTRK